MRNRFTYTKSIIAAACAALLTACTTTTSEIQTETTDGLKLVPDTRFDRVYQKPGVDLSSYTELGLESCEVAFKRNWLRDQNANRLDLSSRVTQKDVDRIKDKLSSACDEQFRAARPGRRHPG